jgi:hypothetical protein
LILIFIFPVPAAWAYFIYASIEDSINYLKNTGTDAAVFTPWQGVWAKNDEDLNQANSEALNLMTRYPKFLYPGVSIHPDFPETSCEWLRRFRERGLMWVGELIFQNHSHRYKDETVCKFAKELRFWPYWRDVFMIGEKV